MATPTYELLDSTTLASSASSVTFTSIDQSYGDLVLVTNHGATANSGQMIVTLNGDSGSNYPYVEMKGDGSSATSAAATGTALVGAPNKLFAEGAPYQTIFQIMDYTATDKHKSVLTRTSAANNRVRAQAARWADTSAVTSITIAINFGADYDTGSSFALYGIAK